MSRKEAVKSDNSDIGSLNISLLGEMFLDVCAANSRQLKCKGNEGIVSGMGFCKNAFGIQVVHIHGSFGILEMLLFLPVGDTDTSFSL